MGLPCKHMLSEKACCRESFANFNTSLQPTKMFLNDCRALKAGEKDPILKPHILSDDVEQLAEEKQQPEIKDSGFARLLKVSSQVLCWASASCSYIPAEIVNIFAAERFKCLRCRPRVYCSKAKNTAQMVDRESEGGLLIAAYTGSCSLEGMSRLCCAT